MKEIDDIIGRLSKIQQTLATYLERKTQKFEKAKEVVKLLEQFVEENFSTEPSQAERSTTKTTHKK